MLQDRGRGKEARGGGAGEIRRISLQAPAAAGSATSARGRDAPASLRAQRFQSGRTARARGTTTVAAGGHRDLAELARALFGLILCQMNMHTSFGLTIFANVLI